MNDKQALEYAATQIAKLAARPRPGLLLDPVLVRAPLPLTNSKLGGQPYLREDPSWPSCPSCDTPLLFVLQLQRSDFPDLAFPRDTELFQIFRCPRWQCEPEDPSRSDRTMVHRFVAGGGAGGDPVLRPALDVEDADEQLPEHAFKVTPVSDYPSSYEGRAEWWGDEWRELQAAIEHAEWFLDAPFWKEIENIAGMKIGGLPSWNQIGESPTCVCGKRKELFFQLASFATEGWEVEMMIGDDGNIYYFACDACGPESLETLWDCG